MPSRRVTRPIAFAGLSVLLGCSSTSTVVRPDRLPPEQGTAQAKAIAGAFAGKDVKVELAAPDPRTGARYYRAMLATAEDGKGFLLLAPPAEPGWVPFDNTGRIVQRNHLLGAGEGFLIGTASGALTGIFVSAFLQNALGCPSSWTCTFQGSSAPNVYVVVTGAALGTLIGWAAGHRKIITF